jgi:hypothetical protein
MREEAPGTHTIFIFSPQPNLKFSSYFERRDRETLTVLTYIAGRVDQHASNGLRSQSHSCGSGNGNARNGSAGNSGAGND